MTKFINSIIFVVITALLAVIGFGFLKSYQTFVKNAAIDGCAQSSSYQNQFTDEQKRLVTNREPQKSIYQACLQFKGLTK